MQSRVLEFDGLYSIDEGNQMDYNSSLFSKKTKSSVYKDKASDKFWSI